MPNIETVVMHEVGLHARPAAKFVELVACFACEVTLRNLTQQGPSSNAKSILGVLAAG